MTFQKRLELHDRIQEYLLYVFDCAGYPCEPYGIESGRGLKIHKELVGCKNHTAIHVRHQPDKVVVKDGKAIFIDIKTQSRYDTENFSVELASYETCRSLEKIDCEVLYIFNKTKKIPYDLHACHVKNVVFRHINEKPDWTVKGSRTPFGLVYKNDPYIKPITEFFENVTFPNFIAKLPGQQNLNDIITQLGGAPNE